MSEALQMGTKYMRSFITKTHTIRVCKQQESTLLQFIYKYYIALSNTILERITMLMITRVSCLE